MSLRDRAGAFADRVPGWVLVGLVVASLVLFVWGLAGALSRETPPGGAGPVPEVTRTAEPTRPRPTGDGPGVLPTIPPPTSPGEKPPPTTLPTPPPTTPPATEPPKTEPPETEPPEPVPTEPAAVEAAYVLVTLPDSITPPSSFVCAPVEDLTRYCLAPIDEVQGTSLEPAQAPDPVPVPAAPDTVPATEEGQRADPSSAAAASSGPRLIDDITTIGGVLIAPMMLATAAIITSLQSRPKTPRTPAGAVSRERRRPAQ